MQFPLENEYKNKLYNSTDFIARANKIEKRIHKEMIDKNSERRCVCQRFVQLKKRHENLWES